MKMKSPTYGDVTMDEVTKIINDYCLKQKEKYNSPFHIIVGTDSQNFSDTKVVTVIVAQSEGHGGIYFYHIERVNRIQDVRNKLNYETQTSLTYADELIKTIESKEEYLDMYLNSSFAIHVDAGHSDHGKTKELIPSLVGWIKSCGYECEVKPDSFAASSIADKISK